MLIDKNKYKESLSLLWHKVFGDEYSFIELIFNKEYEDSIICFAKLDGERAVSAFYLLKNELKYKGDVFYGYYLYAAATLPEYRGKGLMSELIRQTQSFCGKQGIDYISLVPSEMSLYGYYSGLGFEKAMYRFVSSDAEFSLNSANSTELHSAEQILAIRRKYKGNIINFTEDSFGYAFDCMKYSGFSFKALSSDALLIAPDTQDSYGEFIASDADSAKDAYSLIEAKGKLTSPFELDLCKKNEAVPYGMLYPINQKLKRDWNFTDIYMNIALD